MNTEYYRGSAATPAALISAADAQNLTTYTRAFREANGALAKTELHDHGALVEVNYYETSLDDIMAASSAASRHTVQGLDDACGIPRIRLEDTCTPSTIQANRQVRQDCRSRSTGTDADRHGREQRDSTTRKSTGTESHGLRYLYEYDEQGHLYSGYDVLHGDNASLAEVSDVLAEPEFYQSGYTLPRRLGDTAIPPDPQ